MWGGEKDERRKEAWKREKHINLVWNYRKISCRQRMPCGESRSYRSFYSQNQQIHARTLILALHLYVCMPPHSSWKSSLKCGYFTEKAFAFCITMLLSVFNFKNPISRWENLSMKTVCLSMCVLFMQPIRNNFNWKSILITNEPVKAFSNSVGKKIWKSNIDEGKKISDENSSNFIWLSLPSVLHLFLPLWITHCVGGNQCMYLS